MGLSDYLRSPAKNVFFAGNQDWPCPMMNMNHNETRVSSEPSVFALGTSD